MIVSMMKYSFLLLRSEHEKFLQSIRDLGVVDITINQYDPSQNEQRIIASIKSYQAFVGRMDNVKSSYKYYAQSVERADCDADTIIERFDTLQSSITKCQDNISQLSAKMNEAMPWGDFSMDDIARVEDSGLKIRFFALPEKHFTEEFTSEYAVSEISRASGMVYFLLVEESSDEPIEQLAHSRELERPTRSASDFDREIAQQEDSLESMKMELYSLSLNGDMIALEIENLKEELHYDQIVTSNEVVAEDSLVMIEAWSPTDKCELLDSSLDSMDSVIVIKETPTVDDEPPVLLRNSRFVRSAEFITNMYSLPKYHEADMTPFLTPFFLFFVGICIGDNGYGLILFLAALFAGFKIKDKAMRPTIDFALYCGIATMICGSITGVFFGLEMAEIPLFEPVKELFIPSEDMFYISMAIGLVHIIYAIVIKAAVRIKRFGILYGLSSIGWLVTILASLCAAALPMVGVEGYTTSSVPYYITVAISLSMMIFFQNPKASIFMNLGSGMWSLYNDVVGLLGDVLSYLRLFALGLTGGVIAGVFNDLAVGMSGDIPGVKYVIMILILLIGHLLNIFISFIGAFVHPLRLTFVEFYKNVDFGGGGKPYTPFKKRENNK